MKAFKRTDEYCNYNQIYLDFEICTNTDGENSSNSDDSYNGSSRISRSDTMTTTTAQGQLEQTTSVQHSVLVMCPLCLENDDIKEKEGEALLF